jgi:tetratricopeptide (TPR) repeat protein
MRALIFAFPLFLSAQIAALADDSAATWKGLKVLPKIGAQVKVDDETIDYTGGGYSLPWTVQDTKGDLLLVGDRGEGWVDQSQVVALDDAPAYYSQFTKTYRYQSWAYGMRAFALREKGDLLSAIADYGTELRLSPTARTFCNRGLLWVTKKDFGKAIADFEQAIRIDPTFALAYNNAAWFRATCPHERLRDGKKAVELATKACELSRWGDFNSLDTLGGAYAEAGDFDSAVKFENRAIILNREDADFVKKANERLALYRDQKPYREE